METVIRSLTQDQLVSRAATLFPTQTALIYQGQRTTFAAYARAVDAVASHLAELGVRRESKVGLLMIPSSQYAYSLFATAKLGAVYLVLNAKMPLVEIEGYLRIAGAEVFVIDHRLWDAESRKEITGILERLPAVQHLVIGNGPTDDETHSLDAWLAQGASEPIASQANLEDEVLYNFTSGTTGGRPRALVRSHSDLVCTTDYFLRLGLDDKDVMLSMIPLTANVGVLVCLVPSLVTGAAVVVPDFKPGTDRIERFLQLIEKERVTFLHGSPTLFLQMIASPALDRYDLSSLRLAIVTGAPIAPPELQAVAKRLGCRVGRGYGMSECGNLSMVSVDDDEETFLYTCGRPPRDREVKVVSESADPPRDMPVGEVGEFVTRPPGITRYFTFDAASGEVQDLMPQLVDREGWLHTGDLGFIDAKGNVRLIGRSKHIILRGGNTIYPEEIRGVIATHDQVRDVAVIGLPDPVYGEKIRACVVLKDSAACSASEIRDHCRERLEVFKVPDEIRFCDGLPLTNTGKVKLAELRKREENIPLITEAAP